jgi:acetyl esterase/lipase
MMNSPFLLLLISVLGLALDLSGQTGRSSLPEGVRAHRDLVYVEGGHERQTLDLFLPATPNGPVPVIIWVHGGGWQNGSKENCLALRSGFLERGYAVASLNYRLSQHAVFPAQIEDCKAAIRWLRAHAGEYGLDPARFGAWGSSAGGHLVALLGTSGDVKAFDVGAHLDQSSRVQAVCDYFGPTDFIALAKSRDASRPATYLSPESRLIGGFVLDHPDKVTEANPITYVSADDPPFLIVHGDQDPLVPLAQSQLLFEAMKQSGLGVRFHTIRGGAHGGPGFSSGEVETMVADFFEARLKKGNVEREAVATETGGKQAVSAPTGLKLDGERWNFRDGDFEMSGVLLKPAGKGPFPGVLISHGLGGSAESFGRQKAEEMVRWGMVCIAPNYAHTRNAKDRSQFGASAENLRRAAVCLEILRQMPEVDATRLAAYGHSMGGFVTIGLAADGPKGLKAAAITGSGIAPQEGFPAPSAAVAAKVRTPFLMLHGANDTTVRPELSLELKKVLDASGVANDRLIADGQGHPIDQSMRVEVFRLVREWFATNGVLAR